MDPQLSVIIPTKGHEPHLPDLIGSLLEQTSISGHVPMEILIVDAPSPSWNRVAADAFTAVSGLFPGLARLKAEVRYVKQEAGRKGSAMNLGAAEARSDVLLFLDADIVLPPTAVRWALSYLYPPYLFDVVSALRRHEQLGLSVFSERIVRWWGFVTPWFCMMRRRTLEGLGGWTGNSEKPWDFEDVDLWIQTRRRGLRVGFIPTRVVLKRRVQHELKKTWHFLVMLFRTGGVFRPGRSARTAPPPSASRSGDRTA